MLQSMMVTPSEPVVVEKCTDTAQTAQATQTVNGTKQLIREYGINTQGVVPASQSQFMDPNLQVSLCTSSLDDEWVRGRRIGILFTLLSTTLQTMYLSPLRVNIKLYNLNRRSVANPEEYCLNVLTSETSNSAIVYFYKSLTKFSNWVHELQTSGDTIRIPMVKHMYTECMRGIRVDESKLPSEIEWSASMWTNPRYVQINEVLGIFPDVERMIGGILAASLVRLWYENPSLYTSVTQSGSQLPQQSFTCSQAMCVQFARAISHVIDIGCLREWGPRTVGDSYQLPVEPPLQPVFASVGPHASSQFMEVPVCTMTEEPIDHALMAHAVSYESCRPNSGPSSLSAPSHGISFSSYTLPSFSSFLQRRSLALIQASGVKLEKLPVPIQHGFDQKNDVDVLWSFNDEEHLRDVRKHVGEDSYFAKLFTKYMEMDKATMTPLLTLNFVTTDLSKQTSHCSPLAQMASCLPYSFMVEHVPDRSVNLAVAMVAAVAILNSNEEAKCLNNGVGLLQFSRQGILMQECALLLNEFGQWPSWIKSLQSHKMLRALFNAMTGGMLTTGLEYIGEGERDCACTCRCACNVGDPSHLELPDCDTFSDILPFVQRIHLKDLFAACARVAQCRLDCTKETTRTVLNYMNRFQLDPTCQQHYLNEHPCQQNFLQVSEALADGDNCQLCSAACTDNYERHQEKLRSWKETFKKESDPRELEPPASFHWDPPSVIGDDSFQERFMMRDADNICAAEVAFNLIARLAVSLSIVSSVSDTHHSLGVLMNHTLVPKLLRNKVQHSLHHYVGDTNKMWLKVYHHPDMAWSDDSCAQLGVLMHACH
jgi:hypothetical protein